MGFSHGLIFARQIFPFETFTTHFYLAGCPGNICEGYFSLPLLDTPGPPIGHIRAPMHESICSRFERKCNKGRERDGFMIYQKHFTIWQSSLEQISKCLFYGSGAERLFNRCHFTWERMLESRDHHVPPTPHPPPEGWGTKQIGLFMFF